MTGLVGQAEVERAQAVLDHWLPEPIEDYEHGATFYANDLLQLRGMIAAALADAYSDGYVAGIQRGKVDTVQRVMETLHEL